MAAFPSAPSHTHPDNAPVMRKKYFCEECKAECSTPTYLRLQLTRCGWTRVSHLPRWQRAIPVGIFCEECLVAVVRTAMASNFDLSRVEKRSSRRNAPVRLRTQEEIF